MDAYFSQIIVDANGLNNDLSWKSYLNGDENNKGLFSRLSQKVGLLKRLASHSNRRNLKLLANGLFYSNLQYCLPLITSTWNLDSYRDVGVRFFNFSKEDCRKLQVLQNQVCRIILGYQYLYKKQSVSTEELLKKCNQLSIHQYGALSTIMLVKKSLLKGRPCYFSGKLKVKEQRNLRRNDYLEPINANLNVTRSSFFYRGVKLYNLLPRGLQEETSLNVFKRKVTSWVKSKVSIKP